MARGRAVIDVPDALMQSLLRGVPIVAEIPPIDPENRAWVDLRKTSGHNALRPTAPRGPVEYVLYRFEVSREIIDSGMEDRGDLCYRRHVEKFRTTAIGEAVERALEYQPDWSKWRRTGDDPDMPC